MTDRIIREDLELQAVAMDGAIHLLMSARNDKNELVPAQWDNFIMPAESALAFASLVADLAYETETKLKPAGAGLKAAAIERARVKLNNRVAIMLRSLDKQRQEPKKMAELIVDACLREVLE